MRYRLAHARTCLETFPIIVANRSALLDTSGKARKSLREMSEGGNQLAMEVDGNEDLSESTAKENNSLSKNGKTLISSKHVLRKRQSFGLRKSDKDIYINNKTNFKGQLYKCEKLFDKGASELIIHGLGATVHKACNLALRLKEIHYGTLELDIKTSTVTLIDKLEALVDDAEDEINSRQNSAVHIRVSRTLPVSKLRQTD